MEPYSNREIDAHFIEMKETLRRIETQVMRTNGRVTSLEAWRNFSVGAIAVISALVLPLVSYIWNLR
jgi:hypothetical protein